jgi:non-specific serine/threonine protein kinase/serine/threonine-protein kinase
VSPTKRCSRCNATLSSNETNGGECPACLLELAVDGSRDLAPGSQVGLYRIVREIGEGGMGVVYLAEQEIPIRRRVALKVIKRGMDSRQVVARFEAERQALALMDHPCVARVYEAGETDDGRPYFAMEYIDGEPITASCDRQMLTTRQRLELFGRVCAGVQHAHRRGIIHRDIKPSNVLVTEQDGETVPKIIDFGVAKAIEQHLSEQSLFTETGVMLGTPEYMSPEQADMAPGRVDTRTDVYSLGVLLYELLTGLLPFDSTELRSAAFDEILRRIRHETPSLPSTRVQMIPTTDRSAELRKTDAPGLSREISGDLDAITMKAMEKEPSRRYETPSELMADIQRHLRSETVSARPPSNIYQLRKWIGRNRSAAALGGLFLVSLLIFSIAMTFIFARARAAESAAEHDAKIQRRVTDFMIRLFQVSDPGEARGNRILARELLDEAAGRIDFELADDPGTHAELSASMGAVYRNLGLHDLAEPLIRSAYKTLSEQEGPDALSTLRVGRSLGELLRAQGQLEPAERLLTANIAECTDAFGATDEETLESRRRLAIVYQDQGRYEEAEQINRSVLQIRTLHLGADARETLQSTQDVARVLMLRSRYPEAEALLSDTVDGLTRHLGPDHPHALIARFDLATLLGLQGRVQDADRAFSALHKDQVKVLGEQHPKTVETVSRLAGIQKSLGHMEESEALYLKAIELQNRAGREDNINTLYYTGNLGNLYEQSGRFDEAEAMILEVLAKHRDLLGDEHNFTLGMMNNLGNVYMKQGKLEQAEEIFGKALDGLRRTLGEDHVDTLRTMSNLGLVLWNAARDKEAVELLARTMAGQKRALGNDNRQAAITGYNLAQMLHLIGDLDGARPVFEDTQRINDIALGKTNINSLKTMQKHLALLRDMGDEPAVALLEKELKAREALAESENTNTD